MKETILKNTNNDYLLFLNETLNSCYSLQKKLFDKYKNLNDELKNEEVDALDSTIIKLNRIINDLKKGINKKLKSLIELD